MIFQNVEFSETYLFETKKLTTKGKIKKLVEYYELLPSGQSTIAKQVSNN
jgi:hypothetical protein